MRILHLIQSLAHGGAERQLVYLARGLMESRHDVHVGFLDGGPNFSELQASGAMLHHLGRGDVRQARGRGLHNYDARLVFSLVRLIREVKPDLVHTWITQMDIFGGVACRLSRTPWVLREPSSGKAYERCLKPALRAWLARGAQAVVANSAGGADYWRQKAPGIRCWVVPNGVRVDGTKCERPPALAMTPGRKHILYAGRFTPGKNVETLVRAAVEVVRQFPEASVSLCGDGPERAKAGRLAAELGLDRHVRLAGDVSDIWEVLKRADVFVSLSLLEGQPNCVLEAMSCGCPVVVSDIAAHRELLDETSALFVSPLDVSQVAEAIRLALSRPEEARERAERARLIAKRHSVAAMTSGYVEVYRHVLDDPVRLTRKAAEAEVPRLSSGASLQ
ncbi:MAG TPA: glycosyltransferase [Bryobacteraceae bacterium]|nr:glycosyltransferase [Bryobacteraceae bacterium]